MHWLRQDLASARRLGGLGRVARGALLVLAGAWAAWVVAIQLFLWTPLLRSLLNHFSPAIHVDYAFAWSAWPGTIHARGLRLTSQDRAVQWQLDLDQLATDVVLTELPRRIFHATRVRASGISFALRRRIPGPQLSPERLDGLPEIDGLPSPKADEGPPDEIPDWRYKYFSIWLEDVDGREVKRIQIDALQVDHASRVAGAFYLKPVRSVLIAPAELWFDDGAVSLRRQPIARGLKAHFAVRLAPFDPRGLTFPVLARAADLVADGQAELTGLELLHQLGAVPGRLEGGGGPARFALRVQAGQVLPGTAFDARLARAVYRDGQLRAQAAATVLDLSIPAGPPPQTARGRLELFGLEAGTSQSPRAFQAPLLRAGVEAEPPDLAEPRPPRQASFELRGGQLGDLRALAKLIPAARGLLQIDRGQGELSAQLAGPFDRLTGSVHLALSSVQARAQGITFGGALALQAKVRALDPSRGADLSGTELAIDRARVVNRDGEQDTAPDWWGRIKLPRAQLRLVPGRDPEAPFLDAELSARCRDARPLVGLYARLQDLPGFVRGLFAMDDLVVTGSALAGKGYVALRDLTAKGDHAQIRATYRKSAAEKRGAALLTVRGLSVALELQAHKTSLHLLRPGGWFADEQKQLAPRAALGPLPRARTRPARRRATPVAAAR